MGVGMVADPHAVGLDLVSDVVEEAGTLQPLLFGLGFVIPVIGPLLFFVNTILSVILCMLMARGFFRLGRQLDRLESSVITRGAFAS